MSRPCKGRCLSSTRSKKHIVSSIVTAQVKSNGGMHLRYSGLQFRFINAPRSGSGCNSATDVIATRRESDGVWYSTTTVSSMNMGIQAELISNVYFSYKGNPDARNA